MHGKHNNQPKEGCAAKIRLMAAMDGGSVGGDDGKNASATTAMMPVQQGRWHGHNNSKDASKKGNILGNNQPAQRKDKRADKISYINGVDVHLCHCPCCCHCRCCPPSILITPASIRLAVLPLLTAAAAGVATLYPPLLLTPASTPHAIVKVGNPPVNIASVDGGCAVTIVVAPDINNISVPREDGIPNVHCRAVAAIAAPLTTNDITAVAISITAVAANITTATVIATATTTTTVVVADAL
jgi:hypothetical protein